MGDRIFLSYRRDDASADARSIYQRLRTTFGRDQLFIDVDAIERGRDFRDALERNLDDCRVLVAVIGPKWVSAQDENGNRRLDSENDFVRLEVSRALSKNIVVIPVLVGNATIPKPEQLPEDLRGLVFRQAALVRHESFPQDMEALERDIRKSVGVKRRWVWVAAAALSAVLGLFLTSSSWFPVIEGAIPGLAAVTANIARDKDIASVMARCVKDPQHPEKEEIVQNIAARLSKQAHDYGGSASVCGMPDADFL